MKVLIIDDEKPVREAISILGKWSDIGVCSIAEAENGQQAMRMIMNDKPDIILLDMKMPVVSGLELLQWLEIKYKDVVCIVISGYSDYHFTRQAIRSRVVDYLIKPVNSESLNLALKNAAEIVCLKQKKEKSTSYDKTENVKKIDLKDDKKRFLYSVFEGSYDLSIRDMYGSFLQNEIDCNYGFILIKLMNLRVVRQQYFGNDSNLLFFVINNVVEEIYADICPVLCLQLLGSEQEIVIVSTIHNALTDFNMRDAATKIISSLSDCLSIRAVAGWSQPVENIIDLEHVRKNLQKQINQLNLFDLSMITTFSDQKEIEEKSFSLMNFKDQLEQAMTSGRFEQIASLLQLFCESIREYGYLSIGSADRIRQELLYLFNSIAINYRTESFKPGSDEMAAAELASLDLDYSNYQGFCQMLNNLAAFYYNRIRRQAGQFDISDVKNYLESHFHEEITISELAQRYFMSRGYLMKLFKQKYNRGIFEYLQNLRMERARELLSQTDIKIQEVSEIVGYKDQNYFSKAFRHSTGFSPSEYRLRPTGSNK